MTTSKGGSSQQGLGNRELGPETLRVARKGDWTRDNPRRAIGHRRLTTFSPMYSEQVLDHFHHPRNVGEIGQATAVIEVTNPACGDVMKLWVQVCENRIQDVKFKVAGCVPAVACGSWLTEMIRGKALVELSSLTPDQIDAGLGGLPQASKHAAVLAADALKRLLEKLK